MATRRDLFTTLPALGVALAATPAAAACAPAPPPRPQRARDPIVNHLGYRPGAAKHAVIAPADALGPASIVRLGGGKPGEVAQLPLRTVGGDFGEWKLADFSAVREPGVYRLSSPIHDYFLQLQDPRGHVWFGVYPRDYFNLKDAWDTREYVLMTRPAPRYAQHFFIATQALIARLFASSDPEYAQRCLAAGVRCHDRWAREPMGALTSYDLGTGAFAAAHLHRATGNIDQAAAARAYASRLTTDQTIAADWRETAGRETDPHPDYDLLNARALYPAYAPIGLAAVLETLPQDADAPRWGEALACFQHRHVAAFESANGFGIIPQVPYTPASAPRFREREGRRYRYFIDTGATRLLCPGTRPIPWQAGNNGIVAGTGVALAMIARVTGDAEAARLAQRHWDWIVGVNPLDSSTILGFGRNNPVTYPPVDFTPQVPRILGAGLQGFVGADDDQPVTVGGYYGSGEYWLPQHSWTLWLGALISAHG